LHRQPRSQLGLIHHFDHRFAAAHRMKEVSEQSDVGIQPARIVADARERSGHTDLVVGPARRQSLLDEATIGIKVD
jgi:hypothetical protein